MKLTHWLLGSSLVLAAACGSDKTTAPDTVGESGSLSFSFTGAASGGTYSANGAVPVNTTTTLGSTSWAAADRNTSNQTIDVVASVPKSGSTWDLTSITIAGQTTGTYPISANCTGTVCSDVLVEFGVNANATNFQYFCSLTSGTIVVTSVSSTRAAGTFTGSGSCFVSTGGSTTSFAATNGTFDVGLTTATLPGAALGRLSRR